MDARQSRLALAAQSLGFVVLAALVAGYMQLAFAAKLQVLQIALPACFIAILTLSVALTRQRRALRSLHESEARYRLVADHASDIIISTDVQGLITFVSPSIHDLVQREPAQLIGCSVSDIVKPEHHLRLLDAFLAAITRPGEHVTVEFLGLPLHGEPRWFEGIMRAVANARSEIVSIVGTIRDISQHKATEGALTQAAMTDPLTGLANRRQFDLTLANCIAQGQTGCIAVMDLDHFKRVNDQFGHSAGDQVLRSFARVARQGLRGSDTLARIGGEEFALLLPGASLEMGKTICSRLGTALARTVTRVEDAQITVTTSIGLACFGEDAENALQNADRALYQAKAAGRDRLAIAA